jgi:hypothetical protein
MVEARCPVQLGPQTGALWLGGGEQDAANRWDNQQLFLLRRKPLITIDFGLSQYFLQQIDPDLLSMMWIGQHEQQISFHHVSMFLSWKRPFEP